MFEITGEIPEPIIDELEEARSPGEHGTPSLEVRRCGDGHPPVTKREREIHLNGTSGVKFSKNPDRISIRVFRDSLLRQTTNSNLDSRTTYRFVAFENPPIRSTIHADARTTRPRRRPIFRGRIFWGSRHTGWRNLFQHRHDRLSGSADRSILSRADRGDDVSIDRQLRDQFARPGKPFAARPRLYHRSINGGAQLVALRNVA